MLRQIRCSTDGRLDQTVPNPFLANLRQPTQSNARTSLGRARSIAARLTPLRIRLLADQDLKALLLSCLLLPTAKLLLRRSTLQDAADFIAKRSDPSAQVPNLVIANRVAKAVALVSHLPIVGGSCLPRSLTTWFLLRRRGMDAVVHLGADLSNIDGLPAHAWVEVDGIPLNEAADIGERFGSFGLELPRLSPSQA